MPIISYGLFDVSSINQNNILGYQYLLNGEELYGYY